MKLNIKAIVIAEAVVGAALFILCRLAFAVAPEATLAGLKYLTHIDWSSVTVSVSLGGFIFRLIVFTIFIAVVGGVWAWIYNLVASTPKQHLERSGTTVKDAVCKMELDESHVKESLVTVKGFTTSARLGVGLNLKDIPKTMLKLRSQGM